jgi:site-specific DNA-methyltransferase (adenine-specific)
MRLINDDCLQAMATLPDSSVDAIVTDPPYGLSFMGKAWDYDVPQVEVWREAFRVLKPGGHLLAFFGSRTYHRGAVQIEDAGFEIRDQIMWIYGTGFPKGKSQLKPAHEPVVVARRKGKSEFRIDDCRIPSGTDYTELRVTQGGDHFSIGSKAKTRGTIFQPASGRWPANVIHDGSDEATRLFGEAARFFYCAKASKADRGEGNTHPTVKPTDLMRYLCRLVTPPSGVVLDPFMGSGSTGKAALLEGFDFIGIERDPDYCAIAQERIAGIQPQLQLVAGNFRDPELADLGEVA